MITTVVDERVKLDKAQ